MSDERIILRLLRSGLSKYAIAKRAKVSWNTVHLWSRGVFNPSPENQAILEKLEKTVEETRGFRIHANP